MSASHASLRAVGLSRQYVLGGTARHGTLYDLLSAQLRRPFSRAASSTSRPGEFWALQDVGFEVQPGEVVAVIGRNGAGKSTLLKILSRITAPSRGRVEIRGRLSSLLEVGTGFHPELTGAENIYLNGAILGMKRAEIARHFDAIVEFAEVGKFVNTPVKHYSSGMYVRLAFAVAAHLETDVLLVDEVLAVGDASFQKKSLGKMGEVSRAGRTVVFVSHNLAAVRDLCHRSILLEGGRVRFDGPTAQALATYENALAAPGGQLTERDFTGDLAGDVKFTGFVLKQDGEQVNLVDPMRKFEVEIHGVSRRIMPALEINVTISREGTAICACFDSSGPSPLREGDFVSRFMFPADVFRGGRYTLSLGASTPSAWMWGPDVGKLDFVDNRGGRPEYRLRGVVQLPYESERLQ